MEALDTAQEMTHAHLEDVGAAIAGGVIGFPMLIGAASINYFGYDFSTISYEAAGTVLSLGLLLCIIAGIVSVLTNDLRGDVDTLQKAAVGTAVGLPIGYSFVPLVQEAVHYSGMYSEGAAVGLVLVSYVVLLLTPNEKASKFLGLDG